MKTKIISLILLSVTIVVLFAVFTGCSSGSSVQTSQYISETQRAEHIAMLIGDNTVLARNVREAKLDDEGNEIVSYTWTLDKSVPAGITDKAYLTYTPEGSESSIKRGVKNMSILMENDNFILYMDMTEDNASDIAIEDKRTGHIYQSNSTKDTSSTYANVKAAAAAASGATAAEVSALNPVISPISIEAYDVSNKRYEFNFRDNCLEDKRLEIVKLSENSIRIIYTIGNDPDKELVPPVITVETWSWITEKLSTVEGGEQMYKDLLTCYKDVTPASLTPEDKDRFLDNYPNIEVFAMYIVRVLNTRQKMIVREAMTAAGFTAEMLKKEMEAVEYSGPERAVMFTIPVDITLEEDSFEVSIDSTLIQAPSKQKMYKIYVYRSLGSMTPKGTTDYIIIPDGSGAIMPSKGYLTTDVYTARVYGLDESFQAETITTKSLQIISPFLVMDRSSLGGMVAVLENGTAQAFATARPANSTSNPGASTNFDFVYAERDYLTYSGGQGDSSSSYSSSDTSSSGAVLSKEEQVATFTVRYFFTEGNMTYSEYAEFYRNYLINSGKMPTELKSESVLPFYVEMFGAINRNESVAGIPLDVIKALTSYTEVKQIVSELIDSGVKGINVRYMYWSNEGYYNTINNVPDLLSEMGSQKELNDLVTYLKTNNVGFFPSADFLYIYKDTAFDALNYMQDAARRLDMRVARVYPRYLSTYRIDQSVDYVQTILSADLLPGMAESYKTAFEKIIDNKQISLGNIGKVIDSNYKVGRIVNRTQSYDNHIAVLDTFSEYDLLVTTGNDYTWKYADHIVNLPTGSSEYLSTSMSIPFIQMVLHGYIDYTFEAFNITSDYSTALLKCLETGSGIHFRWMYDENSVFDNTTFYNFFSLNYKDSFDTAVALYKEVASVIGDYQNKPITEHGKATAYRVLGFEGEIPMLQEGEEGYVEGVETPKYTRIAVGNVFYTDYNDSLRVYVNYNNFDVELEDRSVIPAQGYLEEEIK